MTQMYMRGGVYFGTAAQMMDRIEELEIRLVEAGAWMMDRIEELEAKLAESEARSEVLETLIMDVAADLYDGVPDYKIDQRIMDVIRQLNEEEEED